MMRQPEIHIIYAKEDDAGNATGNGWVTSFKKFLQMMLQQTSGKTFTINLLPDTDTESTPKEGLLVVILSTDFILSDFCLDRLNQYMSQKEQTEAVFKVFKSPLAFREVPDAIKFLPDYNLYHAQDGLSQAFYDYFSKKAQKIYWMKMIDLCFDIHEVVVQKATERKAENRKTHKSKAVYLADTGKDLSGARNIIKRELNRHGFDVYPKPKATLSAADWEKEIKQDLKHCIFSIHMFGASYGNTPKDAELSIAAIQNETAAAYAQANTELKRIIWIAPALENPEDKQKTFVHKLKRDANAAAGAEILESSLEDFKNTLWDQLQVNATSEELSSFNWSSPKKHPYVYLLNDVVDKSQAEKVRAILEKKQIQVIQLPETGGLLSLRNHHIAALRQMDAAIIIQDKVNEQWVYMKLLDLLKAPGFGRSQHLLGKLLLSSSAKDKNEPLVEQYQIEGCQLSEIDKINNFVEVLTKDFHQAEVAD